MKNQKKICFFSPSSYELFCKTQQVSHGGAELQMYLLAKYLAEFSDFDVVFFVGNYKQKKIESFNNIKLIRSINLKKKEISFIKIFKAIKLFLQLIKHNPDVIISTTANSIVGIISFYKKIFRKKHIHRTAHLIDVDNTWISENGILGRIYQSGLLNADKIITQNEEHKHLLQKNYNLQSVVLKNAIEIYEIKKNTKYDFLWVGRFEKWKNPELFLNLAVNMSENKFVMICPYTKSDFNEWNNLKIKASEIKNLIFIEKIPFFEIQNYFNDTEIFVNTSNSEGFPNIFLQAAMAKMPIISLNVNPDNFITKYNCGLYCENNFEKLLLHCNLLISDKNQISEKGENAYKFLKENHNIKNIIIEFKSIIESIL